MRENEKDVLTCPGAQLCPDENMKTHTRVTVKQTKLQEHGQQDTHRTSPPAHLPWRPRSPGGPVWSIRSPVGIYLCEEGNGIVKNRTSENKNNAGSDG